MCTFVKINHAKAGVANIGVARGGKGAMFPPKFLENKVILCFERRFFKQNSVIRLKSNILPPPPNFGLATPLLANLRPAGHMRPS